MRTTDNMNINLIRGVRLMKNPTFSGEDEIFIFRKTGTNDICLMKNGVNKIMSSIEVMELNSNEYIISKCNEEDPIDCSRVKEIRSNIEKLKNECKENEITFVSDSWDCVKLQLSSNGLI